MKTRIETGVSNISVSNSTKIQDLIVETVVIHVKIFHRKLPFSTQRKVNLRL